MARKKNVLCCLGAGGPLSTVPYEKGVKARPFQIYHRPQHDDPTRAFQVRTHSDPMCRRD